MLGEEQQRLHRLPQTPFTVVFGQTRSVSWSATISFGGVTYSIPHTLAGDQVWVRVDGDELVATHVGEAGPVEVPGTGFPHPAPQESMSPTTQPDPKAPSTGHPNPATPPKPSF